jgi:hypothetical protein
MQLYDRPVLINQGTVYGTVITELEDNQVRIKLSTGETTIRYISEISFVGWQIVITGSEAMCGGAVTLYSKRVWFNREAAQAECAKCLKTCLQDGKILPYERNVAVEQGVRLREVEILI